MANSLMRVIISLVNVAQSVIRDETVRRLIVLTLVAAASLVYDLDVVATYEEETGNGKFCIETRGGVITAP